jgi:two-component system capsular synthesis sensor histidine kinase RcsC
LRQRGADLPIIGVTANALREEGERCAAVGMNAWLVKPLNLQTLRTQLIKHCKKPVAAHADSAPIVEAPSSTEAPVQLSAKMQELFISTLQQDMQDIRTALNQEEADRTAQKLHSVAGSLGVIQASALAQTCALLECRLTGHKLTPALTLDVHQVLEDLNALLATFK